MEAIFPGGTSYAAIFLVGMRKNPAPPHQIQRTGTAVLKRTYTINPAANTLAPAADALPIFLRDWPANLLLNSDFESPLDDWAPENTRIIHVDDPADNERKLMQVTGNANGRVVQTLTFDEPLGGREFTFRLEAGAGADANTSIQNVRLEANGNDGNVITLCTISADLTTTMSKHVRSGAWPSGLAATEMRVVLRMATDATRVVWYDNVQVEERSYETIYNPATTLRYEHDLAAYKPEGDVIVLDYAGASGADNNWAVRVANSRYIARTLPGTSPPEKSLFGWEVRVDGERKQQSGTYPTPPPGSLPTDFDNRFFNGYWRQGATRPLNYLPAAALIEIVRGVAVTYSFRLAGDTAVATHFTYSGSGPDNEDHWQGTAVPMNLDTLVIEPEKDRCYAVWRGVWPYDSHAEDAYRRLLVEARS